ncbi:hypothetical protein ACFQHV_05605 [Promicromonospora thailandica]|uniref:Uncharacterized protein n=1 Tax=Promicromonospora thailandica TaxID=765201 RepID=A0A9X2FYR4_9MICO|nr:hypothetical protein [Promicromonospora thailandica]MCP2263812.1 hypothetical protein [Promicromonospora thailandica]BFF17896.1 hypothetical protein GCM10025730_14170 [Promicromonospora thailandica]
MWWSVILLVVCLVLAVGVFVVASQMDAPSNKEEFSALQWFRSGVAHLRGDATRRKDGRRHGASAVATHAVGAPSVWVGKPPVVRPDTSPVDMGMSEFFAATIESKPGYVDAEELTDVLNRARDQAQKTLHVPLGTVPLKPANLVPGQLRAVRPVRSVQKLAQEPPAEQQGPAQAAS